jgi:DNA-binding NarL/FixJ family response regulator
MEMELADNKIKILIIGSDPLWRIGIKSILSNLGDVSVTEASSKEANYSLIEDIALVILVISSPRKDDVEILEKIKKDFPGSPIMIFDAYNQWNEIGAVMSGAKAYLNKKATHIEILDSAKMLLSGRMYMTEATAEQIAVALSARNISPDRNNFCGKEFQILRSMAVGNSNKKIAEQLTLIHN